MLTLNNKADLERLITEQIQESLTLDYKASPALGKSESQRNELCKDVTAFANSAGGQIVYGVEEDKQYPTKLDDGADAAITKEWIEQVLSSRVQPRIDGLIITPIQLAAGLGFVITIPQATSRAPHQAPDKKYYKRQNFQSAPMEDYEIRDALRRSTTPLLKATLSFGAQSNVSATFPPNIEVSRPILMYTTVTNESPQPAYHSVLWVGLDNELVLPVNVGFDRSGIPAGESANKHWLVKRFNSPPDQPIFQETTMQPLTFSIAIESKHIQSTYFDIVTIVQTPGFLSKDYWAINCVSARLKLYGPNDPNWLPEEARRKAE
jgi:hypothetical protein